LDAIRTLEKEVVPSLKENLDFKIRKSLYYASNHMDVSKLKEEYRNLKTRNFPVEYYTEKESNGNFRFRKQERWLQIMMLKSILINMYIY